MLEQLIKTLGDFEPTISSIVGLITLAATFWGVVQIGILARRRGAQGSGSTDASIVATNNSLWSVMMNLGLGGRSQLEELVSVRSVNVALMAILGLSLSWLVISLFSRSTLLLTLINLFVFVTCLVALAMQGSGRNGVARWLALLVSGLYWIGVMLAVGPLKGVEYFLAALMGFPILIFSRAQFGQMCLAIGFALLLFAGGILLHQTVPPLVEFSDEYLHRGYFLNAILLAVIVYAAVRYYREFASSNYHMLENQKRRNDELVNNMLPQRVASRVLQHEEIIAEWHPDATVLFATIDGLDALYKKMSAVDLVKLLSQIFQSFDRLVAEYQVEKVRSLGTNYVIATGIVAGSEPDPRSVAACALAMQDAVRKFSERSSHSLEFKAGVACGQAISGVIGEARPCFDIWGEAVERASLIQLSTFSGILVDEAAFWRIEDSFSLTGTGEERLQYQLYGKKPEDA